MYVSSEQMQDSGGYNIEFNLSHWQETTYSKINRSSNLS